MCEKIHTRYNDTQLTSRVEDLETMLVTVHDYVEKVTANLTENTGTVDRTNPGMIIVAWWGIENNKLNFFNVRMRNKPHIHFLQV